MIADNLSGFWLYPAAFGVLALSRAYGVARSAAVPRLLPPGLGLSQAGARASVYGTVAGAIVAPIGALAFKIGAQWPLRAASLIFLIGAFVAMNLPPKADSDPPERVPKMFQLPWRHRGESGRKVLSGPLVWTALAGSAGMRALYGFLLLFLAFSIREDGIDRHALGLVLPGPAALGVVGGALGLGTFLSTAIGTRLRIRRPIRLQALGFAVVSLAAVWAAFHFTLIAVAVFCLFAAIASGLAKLAVDASIQERIPDTVRASAFAHAETLLMLAWVVGGTIGLIPFLDTRVGLALTAIAVITAAIQTSRLAWRLRAETLRGDANHSDLLPTPATPLQPYRQPSAPPSPGQRRVPLLSGESAGVSAGSNGAGHHLREPSTQDSGAGDPRSGA
jgi:Major Facilitator Superfamily